MALEAMKHDLLQKKWDGPKKTQHRKRIMECY